MAGACPVGLSSSGTCAAVSAAGSGRVPCRARRVSAASSRFSGPRVWSSAVLTLGRFLLLDRSVSGSETAAEKREPRNRFCHPPSDAVMPRCGAPLVRALCGAAGPGRAPRAPARRCPAGGPAGSPPRWPPPPLPRVLWPCLRAAFAVRGVFALLGGHTVPLAAGTVVTLGSLAGSRVLPLPLAGQGAAGSPRHGHV